jgi:cobalt/nickel transport system permease protein
VIFVAAALGDLLAYIVTAGQLAVAYPSDGGGVMESFVLFMGVFAPTQVPLAILEGVLTVLIFIALEKIARRELEDVGILEARA